MEYKGISTFIKGISSKLNVMVRLEFELGYYDVAAQEIRLYAKGSPP